MAVLAIALVVAGLAPVSTAAAAPPKVAIIVGPVGPTITAHYRLAADAAAAAAAALTPNVVKVYSPDATWRAVRAAVTGASVVVYLGHGNGWPSPYASSVQPRTMDGFGLNPVAGVDDTAHQYFGEGFIAHLQLAPGAVVLLSRLCYASGSAEPGMSDGTFGDVLSRVDNFASGFLAAGAAAVVAEGHQDPAALIDAALSGPAAVATAWTNASWGHDNVTSYASSRTPGATVSLDPDTATAGYYRSLVRRSGTSGRQPGVAGITSIPVVPPGPPSLASAGAQFGGAVLDGTVVPGGNVSIRLPVTRAASVLPASMLVGVRWLPLVSTGDSSTATTDDGLIVGEASADVVQTASATRRGGSIAMSIPTPVSPGTYVVLMTLEAPDGTAYDIATQALLRPFIVTVPKPMDVRITAPAVLAMAPGDVSVIPVEVANTGTQPWGSSLYASIWADPSLDPALDPTFSSVLVLSANWLDSSTGTVIPAGAAALPRSIGAPGNRASVNVLLVAPPTPGEYLLILSLTVRGDLGSFPQVPLTVPATIAASASAPGDVVPALGVAAGGTRRPPAGYVVRTVSPPIR